MTGMLKNGLCKMADLFQYGAAILVSNNNKAEQNIFY